MTPDIVKDTAIMRADMRAKLDEWDAEIKLLMAASESRRARERVFVVFFPSPRNYNSKSGKKLQFAKTQVLTSLLRYSIFLVREHSQTPRFVSNKKPSPLLYTCQGSREVAFKEHYTLALQYDKCLQASYAPVYSHPNDIIYLQINVEEDPSILNREIENSHYTILNAVNQGITTLALNFDSWSRRALVQRTELFKKLEHLFFVVAVPYGDYKRRRLYMYPEDDPELRYVSRAQDHMFPRLRQIFAKLKREDPNWEPPVVELVSMNRE
ncbi:hypothetical protein SBOR_2794 [Sclerotinia borealis F-4128]|uniref:Uncharacterized protein n=1 Tax=Sclerotinia borealis (strain F-4128) TaxID=1432307 RepID=W9CLB5_SCLBF|nr:hypothetical protein SBOR_2794 [Sclerotinia borealis F-4128]